MNIKEAIGVLEEVKRLSTVPIVIKDCINTKLLILCDFEGYLKNESDENT